MIKRQIRLDHVISFADAIFAFSITFMAISIHIPEIAQNLNQAQVIDKLLESIPEFEIYVISFFVIGVYWIAYHQLFNHIAGSHSTMTWLTIVFLFFITLIPIATNLQIGFGQYQIVFALYALVHSAEHLENLLLFGSVEECIQKINTFREAGTERIHFWLICDFEEQMEIFRKEMVSHY